MHALFCYDDRTTGKPAECISCFPKEFLHLDEGSNCGEIGCDFESKGVFKWRTRIEDGSLLTSQPSMDGRMTGTILEKTITQLRSLGGLNQEQGGTRRYATKNLPEVDHHLIVRGRGTSQEHSRWIGATDEAPEYTMWVATRLASIPTLNA